MHKSQIEIANNLLNNLNVAIRERDKIIERLPKVTEEIERLRQNCVNIGIDMSDSDSVKIPPLGIVANARMA